MIYDNKITVGIMIYAPATSPSDAVAEGVRKFIARKNARPTRIHVWAAAPDELVKTIEGMGYQTARSSYIRPDIYYVGI